MASWNLKEKEEIEFRVNAIKQFLEMWHRYDDLFNHAFYNKEATPEQEEEFFKLKSQLARRHQYLLEYLGKEYDRAEPITPYLSDTVTLQNMIGIHFDFYKKLCLQWHDTTLRLNEALGYLLTHLDLEVPLEE
ncbi:MAG: hypothetical protein C4527_00790 [Candidatus Omnitrophota bacterium]|nr:MAG: hypothetical protein C4527_00790 [Candidatus Omnitrophota bacterium]